MKFTEQDDTFRELLLKASQNAHSRMVAQGFWKEGTRTPLGLTAKLALIGCEVAEVIECVRKDPAVPSAKCPEISCEAEECADIFLRLIDYCGARDIDLGDAVVRKNAYNLTRPHMHGKTV